ncbi:RT0821/Lpp0805 family surface protein [Lichenifustis flavocetrariae]|uniref:RT0821/Lpp0805 family surface protein n=1 Tax=Lichenifustis flavocetrariae TaxID=2949735 RepID=A0AA42CK19_9HYPH|nr:RT0821/Lpp0805 family surface protein [Lichenifustis flavocetrariae]MCW6510128.1 RT0821/Lpp0805 family surface protein [Lichenifustis flavocetrariae]
MRRLDRFVTRMMLLGLCGGLLPGCSLAVPMVGVTTDDLATGTIKRTHPSPFSAEMDAEDWRRAKSALDTALDPQGNGASVAWDNPTSGAKGSFLPLAQPYPKDDGICRPFAAHLALKGETEHVIQASACRVNSGEWIVGRIAALAQRNEAMPKKSDNLADRDTSTHLR